MEVIDVKMAAALVEGMCIQMSFHVF